MTNIIKIHTLILNRTTLLLALLLDITPTLVFILIVVILEITLTLSDPIKLHIAPSQPRYHRSRSHSYYKPKFQPTINHIEPTPSEDTPSEINMNYPTITNAITPSSWCFKLYISQPKTDTSTPSKLEIPFLLDSGAFIPVLNLPTYTTLAEKFLHCSSHVHPPPSKTITVANKAQVPILFNINFTCHTSINNDSQTIIITFAVAISNLTPLALHFSNNMLNLLILKT